MARGLYAIREPSLLYEATSKGCDETPINTGFEGTHTFVILRYPKIHLSVEARHWKKGACSGFH